MKNVNYSDSYRSLGFEKIDCPKGKKKSEPKVTKTQGKDIRCGGKK
ncbi:MAG: hypothetical protein J6Q68_01415 [Clostridia bacterium]|nr:hypothetical protein [Clostridia bacterium]